MLLVLLWADQCHLDPGSTELNVNINFKERNISIYLNGGIYHIHASFQNFKWYGDLNIVVAIHDWWSEKLHDTSSNKHHGIFIYPSPTDFFFWNISPETLKNKAIKKFIIYHQIRNTLWDSFNSSPPGQNGHHFTDEIFRCIFMNEKYCILIQNSLKFVPKGPNDNKPPSV